MIKITEEDRVQFLISRNKEEGAEIRDGMREMKATLDRVCELFDLIMGKPDEEITVEELQELYDKISMVGELGV